MLVYPSLDVSNQLLRLLLLLIFDPVTIISILKGTETYSQTFTVYGVGVKSLPLDQFYLKIKIQNDFSKDIR